MGRRKDTSKQPKLTYEEAANMIADHDTLTIHYDGISKTGHWYEDHMLNMFSECKLIQTGRTDFHVYEWPPRMTHGEGV